MGDSKPKNSRHPAPMPAPRAAKTARTDEAGPDPKQPVTLEQIVAELLARFAAEVTAEERAWLLGRVSDAAAHKMGARVNAAQVIAETLRALRALGWCIARKEIAGYGPRRARFTVDLARGALPQIAALAAADGAVAETTDALRKLGAAVAPAQRDAVAVLGAYRVGKETSSADKAAVKAEPGAPASRGMKLLARKAERVRDAMPASLLEDAGLADAQLDVLVSGSAEVDALRERLTGERQRAQVLRHELAATAGRVHRELKALMAAHRKASKDDPRLPDFTTALAPKAKPRKPKAKPPTPTPA